MSFMGRVSGLIQRVASLPDSIYVYDTQFTTATASFTISSTGGYSSVGTPFNPSGTWLISGNASDYEVRYALTSGSVSSGTLNTWMSLGTSRTWVTTANRGAAPNARQTAIGTLEIRHATLLNLVAVTTLTIDAYSTDA